MITTPSVRIPPTTKIDAIKAAMIFTMVDSEEKQAITIAVSKKAPRVRIHQHWQEIVPCHTYT